MKRGFLSHIFHSQSGIAIAQAIIMSAGVLLMALASMRSNQNNAKFGKTLSRQIDIAVAFQQISAHLDKPANCEAAVGNRRFNADHPLADRYMPSRGPNPSPFPAGSVPVVAPNGNTIAAFITGQSIGDQTGPFFNSLAVRRVFDDSGNPMNELEFRVRMSKETDKDQSTNDLVAVAESLQQVSLGDDPATSNSPVSTPAPTPSYTHLRTTLGARVITKTHRVPASFNPDGTVASCGGTPTQAFLFQEICTNIFGGQWNPPSCNLVQIAAPPNFMCPAGEYIIGLGPDGPQCGPF